MKKDGEHDDATDEEALMKHEVEGYERKRGGGMKHHKGHKHADGGAVAARANGGATPAGPAVAARKRGGGIHASPNHRPGHGAMHPHHGRADGGSVAAAPAVARKRGGHVPGKHSEHRPDRRARGGGTSDMHPLTSAGNMTMQPYERDQQPKADEHMKGADRD